MIRTERIRRGLPLVATGLAAVALGGGVAVAATGGGAGSGDVAAAPRAHSAGGNVSLAPQAGTAERDSSVTVAGKPNGSSSRIERATAPGLDEQPAPAP